MSARLLWLSLILLGGIGAGCTPIRPDRSSAGSPDSTGNPTLVNNEAEAEPGKLTPEAMSWTRIPQEISWQVQYSGEIDRDLAVNVFNVDLFEISTGLIREFHERGIFAMCYFSAGSFEEWRPDSGQFPGETLGKDMAGWPGEKWLDIRRLDLLAPIMEARMDLARQKGCDGVDPDNVNGYENDTGFPLTADDQLTYNRSLAAAAHQRGLAIGLKNDLDQTEELVSEFDWIINESCFTYQECDRLQPFLKAGKPVLVIEYGLSPPDFCPQANRMGFFAIHKHRKLDAYRVDCHNFSTDP